MEAQPGPFFPPSQQIPAPPQQAAGASDAAVNPFTLAGGSSTVSSPRPSSTRAPDPLTALQKAYGDPADSAWGGAELEWLLWSGAAAPAATLVAWWRATRLCLVTRNLLEEGRPLQEAYGALESLRSQPDFERDELYVDAEHRHPLLSSLHDPSVSWESSQELVRTVVWSSSPVQRISDKEQGLGVRRAVRGSMVPAVPDCEALFDFENTIIDWLTERLVCSPERSVSKLLTSYFGCGSLEIRDILELGKQQIRSSVAFDMANERALHITRLQHLLEKATSAMELNVQFRVLHELARVLGLNKVMPTDLPAEIGQVLHQQSEREERAELRISLSEDGTVDDQTFTPEDVEADDDDHDMDMLNERAAAGIETMPPPSDEMDA